MATYIEREAFMKKFSARSPLLMQIREYIAAEPAADVAPVVHGRWEWDNRFHDYTCSECHNWDLKTPNYCSNCGARMDGE